MTIPMNEDDAAELAEILAYWNQAFAAVQERLGHVDFETVQTQIGRSGDSYELRDGERVKLHTGIALSDHRKWAARVHGRPWFSARLAVPAHGEVGEPVCEYDRPPEGSTTGRNPASYVTELTLYPRPPELVPGWIKVELARVGAWDLREDRLPVADLEPTGEPQTPESVGVAPPPGAQWALPADAS